MFEAPFPPYDPKDPSGFSYETVVKRWPVIITGVIDQLYRTNHDLSLESQRLGTDLNSQLQAKITEGKSIIERMSKLKYQMGRDNALEPIPQDGEAHVDTYNSELDRLSAKGSNTWFTAPWLFAECYLYRLIRSCFTQTEHWTSYDPFFTQKVDTFKNSRTAIYQISTTMHEIDSNKSALESDPDKLEVLFKEMIQMCLWGNATDLSLLTHLSPADMEDLQSVGKEAQEARKEFILRDDQHKVWDQIRSLKEGSRTIDFVLDNAGFELFTDLVFADFLVTYTPYVSRVVFHPKVSPWFVSDVTPPDFAETITSLLDPSFFPPPPGGSPSDESQYHHLLQMATRWKKYVDAGTFALSVPLDTPLGGDKIATLADFWTAPWPYWDMQIQANDLWNTLSGSGLVIFKGDLNYRKLTGDVQWPVSTPLDVALGPLAGSFPLLSLRTSKADVVVGISQEVGDKLDESDKKWRVSGRYALISFLPRK